MAAIRGRLVVSCQALPDEPLHGPPIMAAMARAAIQAGAGGIRAQGVADVQAIRAAVGPTVPLIGLIKRTSPGYDVYITPAFSDAEALVRAGADVIALDATDRPRPDGATAEALIRRVRTELGVPVLADVSTLAEGLAAAGAGADLVGTTLSGYTAATAGAADEPDWALLQALVREAKVPVLLEGRVWTPEQARRGLGFGAHAVVVGSAITRPQLVTRRFVEAMAASPPGAAGAAPRPDGAPLALGVDLGGTKVLAGLVDHRGRILRTERYPTSLAEGPAGLLRQLIVAVRDMVDHLSPDERARLVGVGVSTAGQVDVRRGAVVGCTPNLPGWTGTEVARELEAATGLRTWVDNDANAAAFGEAWCGAGRGLPNLVVLTVGTGLGSGVIVDGQVLRGRQGSAGELGHTILVPDGLPCNCGQRGCVEVYVSGTALAAAARRSGKWGEPAPDSHRVFELAREGDADALALVGQMAHHLAIAIVSIVNAFDPDQVLIGGGVAHQGDLFLPLLRAEVVQVLGDRPWDADRVQLAALGNEAGVVGAAGQALLAFGAKVPAGL